MHTGSTDNYGLTQFASTDKPAWLVDYNEDMRKIDAGMKGNADGITELGESISQEGEDITNLKERMAVAEQDIDSAQEIIGTGELETQVKNLIGACNELLALIHDNDGDITQLQQSIAGIGDTITGLSQLAFTIANVYDSAQTYEVGDYAIYQNTLYKCVTAITVGEAFDPAKWTSVKVMNEMPSGGGGGEYSAGTGIDITDGAISVDIESDNTGFVVYNKETGTIGLSAALRAQIATVTPTILIATLEAGQTSLTFTNAAIMTTSVIDIYTSIYGVAPTDATSSTGTLTFTFEAQASDLTVEVDVYNV